MLHKRFSSLFLALLALICLLSSASSGRGAASQQMLEPHTQAMPLAPFLDYLIDETMLMDVEEASRATGWQPLSTSRLPREEGAMWLRFTIAPIAADAKPQTFLLDMGQSVPGRPILYEPVLNELSGAQEWRENLPAKRNILLLPEAAPEAQPCYIRIDGLPGPWFAPMIRTPHNAATNWGSLARPAAILALGVVMVLCFLRGLGEKGQWRYWTGLFVAAALAQAVIGMPQVEEKYTAVDLAAILLPGICLMFLPHVGRHLMNARRSSKAIDIQLFLLSLPGAALAILPLLPGWNWLDRWVNLWPLGAAIFIPTALGAWMMGLRGCRRFLLACLILPLATAIAWLGIEFGFPANVLASGPEWGVAFAALLLAASAMPQDAPKPAEKPQEEKKLPEMAFEPEPVINLEHPLDDPNLRLVPSNPNDKQEETQPALEISAPSGFDQNAVSLSPALDNEKRENALRAPIDDIMREASTLTQCALPPSARQSLEHLLDACQLLANIIRAPGSAPNFQDQVDGKPVESVFNMEKVLRRAHDSVASIAEYSGIALSWYMPPHLGPRFKGDAQSLEEILRLLLESAARASSRGAIKLSARRVPESAEHGHILFTVEDDGQGYPPRERSSLALVKAWELAGKSDGYLSVECSAQGATISFSAHFTPVDEMGAEDDSISQQVVMLTASDWDERRQLARIIETVDCGLLEAATSSEALASQELHPGPLLIAQGKFAKPASADMVREFIRLARQAGFGKPAALAITPDQSQWRMLKASGFTHAMLEPVDPEVLRRTIMRLISGSQAAQEAGEHGDVGASLHKRGHGDNDAPTTLIEQNFSLAASFEGPDWLGEDEDADLVEAAEKSAEPAPAHVAPASKPETPGHEAAAAQPVKTHEPGPEITDSPDSDPAAMPDAAQVTDIFCEWVGEPMPVVKPKSVEKTPAAIPMPEAAPSSGEDAACNGGGREEPVRIGQEPPQTGAGPDESLSAYIVGVEQADAAPFKSVMEKIELPGLETGVADAAAEKGKSVDQASPVRDFVNNSVNLVANTLTSMLKHNQVKQAPPEAEIGEVPPPRPEPAPVDSELMGLLARLDEAMNQANAALASKNTHAIATATGMISREAEEYGLRRLAKLANCVERAARAPDLAAVTDLMQELAIAVERNRIVISQKNS